MADVVVDGVRDGCWRMAARYDGSGFVIHNRFILSFA
jgi:hypothetical protein